MSSRILLSDRARRRLLPWYSRDFLDEVVVLRGSFFGWLFGRFGQHAVTINGTVHLTPKAPEPESKAWTALLGHECYHILQQRQMGWWRFLLRYSLLWRPYHVRQGWRHPLEKPAYDRGGEVLEALMREGGAHPG